MNNDYINGYKTVSDLLEEIAKEISENTACAEYLKLAHNITKCFAHERQRELRFSGSPY